LLQSRCPSRAPAPRCANPPSSLMTL
jgi:hypothetical protein